MQVLCDTSFLIILTNTPAIITTEYEEKYGKLNLLIPTPVLSELLRLIKTANPKRSKMALNTLNICERFEKIDLPDLGKNVDDSIIDYAKNNRYCVATIDKQMIKKLIEKNVTVLTLSHNKIVIGNYKTAKNRQL